MLLVRLPLLSILPNSGRTIFATVSKIVCLALSLSDSSDSSDITPQLTAFPMLEQPMSPYQSNDPKTNDDKLLNANTKLIRLLLRQKWAKAYKFLRTRSGMQQARQTDGHGVSALFVALSNRPPVDIIKRLLEIEPSLSLKVDEFGMVPLHMACRCGASFEVINTLLEHDNGASLHFLDVHRKSPLHYSIAYVCHPLELDESLCSYAQSSQGSTSSFSRLQPSRRTRSGLSDATELSMLPEEFKDQLQVIHKLISIAPQLVICSDRNGDTPIDILQDCKADHLKGPKWERADIVCEVLREVSIQFYKERKRIWENIGVPTTEYSTIPVIDSVTNESSLSSLYSGLDIDSVSFSRMDISSNGCQQSIEPDVKGKKKLWMYIRKTDAPLDAAKD